LGTDPMDIFHPAEIPVYERYRRFNREVSSTRRRQIRFQTLKGTPS
jgi:hypothetical protein